jgi:tRNA G46 methylase TrmB
MDILSLSLIPGGMIFFATDFKDYFDQMLEVSDSCSSFSKKYCKVILPQQAEPEKALTSYERKYLIQGRQIYRAGYIRE